MKKRFVLFCQTLNLTQFLLITLVPAGKSQRLILQGILGSMQTDAQGETEKQGLTQVKVLLNTSHAPFNQLQRREQPLLPQLRLIFIPRLFIRVVVGFGVKGCSPGDLVSFPFMAYQSHPRPGMGARIKAAVRALEEAHISTIITSAAPQRLSVRL